MNSQSLTPIAADPKALVARAEARAARADLFANVEALKLRLSPSVRVGEAVERAKARSNELAADAVDLANDAVDTVRRQPALAGGIGGLALLLLAASAFRRRARRRRASRPVEPTPISHTSSNR